MADFVLSEREGWEEIEDISEVFELNARQAMWDALGEGRTAAVLNIIRDQFEYAENMDELSEQGERILREFKRLENVEIMLVPDDRSGERWRIWVKWRPGPKDWTPGRRRT